MPTKIAVVVVNWNGWEDTLSAHASLQASRQQDWHLYVVDNASSDDSVNHLRGLTKTTLIENTRNDGFAGACNIGILRASEEQCEFVFLLNNDAVVEPDTLDVLLQHAEGSQRIFFGCAVLFAQSREYQFFGSRTDQDGIPKWFDYPIDKDQLLKPLISTDFIFGAALFARAEYFIEMNVFDERFFLTYEETDLCYRATRKGFSSIIVRDAIVYHQSSKSLGHIASPLQAYFLQRNRLLFLEKNSDLRRLFRGLRQAQWSARHAPMQATRKALWAAIRDYVFRRFGDCPPEIRELAARL
ncbi:glycosyltransferase family 2 protein [Brevundimonas variabilis]|uniref:Glycosyltransferase 2-like domain-containing protein n=1 Tax=Brevundimonas variabilis TaxID=74312 RepID=A0A7W9CJ30_9CAUL|nr:glycosyltransferase family 2 protein [Brevundimonas variabilis]MBB5746328.1 hypothetical protein [Brevundimonas variabilis]